MLLEGKKIIVTGGAGGIGTGTVISYVKEGAIVTSIDIQDEKGKEVVAEANAAGPGKATYVHCDLTIKADVDKVFDQAKADMGGLDMLAHIAAKMKPSTPAEDWTIDDINFYWENDINATIFANQAAQRLMKEYDKGIIVNYGSETCVTRATGEGLYAASKAAVAAWTRVIAGEWGTKYNIRCNTVWPTIATPMYRAYVNNMNEEQKAAFQESRRQKHPIKGDMGDPIEDIGPVMVFLASDMSQYITGQIFPVNGGNTMLRG